MKQCKHHKTAHIYPFGAISPVERIKFEAHMSGCPECAAIARESESIKTACATQPPKLPKHGMEERILHALKNGALLSENGSGGNSISDFRWKLIPVAACLSIILLGIVLLTTPDFTVSNEPDPALETAGQNYSAASNYYISDKFNERERNLVSDNDDVAYETYYLSLSKN